MLKYLKDKTGNMSMRFKISGIISLLFIVMSIVIYFVFYNSMQKMLWERECDNAKNQVILAENILRASYDYIPAVNRDWASFDGTYAYMNDTLDEYLEYYLNDYPYQLYELDFITLLDVDGNVKYEGFGPNSKLSNKSKDNTLFNGKYREISTATLNAYYTQYYDPSLPLGINGFLEDKGVIYYVSSHPILKTNKSGPPAGVMIFGRVIDNTVLQNLVAFENTHFDIIHKDNVPSPAKMSDPFFGSNTIVMKVDNHKLAAFTSFEDIFGEPTLAFFASGPRHLYEDGLRFITIIQIIIITFCILILIILMKSMSHMVLRPLDYLIKGVNKIDFDLPAPSLSVKKNSLEFNILAESINNMQHRIIDDKIIIEDNNQRLYYNANFDPLTGLMNWHNIENTLNASIAESKSNSTYIGIYFVDLDRFKFINDTLGHTMGNNYIMAIAQRLQSKLSPTPVVGRFGGDKFIVLLKGLQEKYETHLYADKILSIFKDSFSVQDSEMHITASVGSSTYPIDGRNTETLMKNAEIAMYQAKDLGGNIYCRYTNELLSNLERKIYVENKIRRIIKDNCSEFCAYLQPKVNSQTNEIFGCEALIRWESPEGIIGPDEFIPLAEESGLIIQLSRWMLIESCRLNTLLCQSGIRHTVSVNISAQVLLHKDFLHMIKDAISLSGMDVNLLDIEITEATLAEDIIKINKILKRLHNLGISVSIDDFGTGYSSLSYLKKLQVDRIKIDRSFIDGLNNDEKGDKTIVNAIVALGKNLDMLITAEGVENDLQYEYLKKIGCDEIQGYLVSRPVNFDGYSKLLKYWPGNQTPISS